MSVNSLLDLVGSPALADGEGPLYQRLAAALSDAVDRGVAWPGMLLPPERILADRLGISRSTVVAAYQRLQAAGTVERRQGSGTRVAATAGRGASSAREAELVETLHRNVLFRGAIEGTGGSVDFLGSHLPATSRMSPALIAAAGEELASAAAHAGYFPQGYPPLQAAIARQLTARGVPTSPRQVLVTNGAQQAISLAISFLLHHGDLVAMENPGYPGALDAATAAGAQIVPIPVGMDGARLGSLADILARHSPRLVYLNPTFHNPTGSVMPDAARAEVARLVGRHEVVLIDDGAVEELTMGEEPPPPIAAHAPEGLILTVGTMSKLFWGGLRVGWVRAPLPLLSRLTGYKAMLDLGSSLPSQILATHLLADIADVREERRALVAANFRLLGSLLSDLLPTWSWSMPKGGLSLWVRLPVGNARDLAAEGHRHGVAILPGATMSPERSFDGHLRLTIARPAAVLTDGMRRLAAAWQSYLPRAEAESDALEVIV